MTKIILIILLLMFSLQGFAQQNDITADELKQKIFDELTAEQMIYVMEQTTEYRVTLLVLEYLFRFIDRLEAEGDQEGLNEINDLVDSLISAGR